VAAKYEVAKVNQIAQPRQAGNYKLQAPNNKQTPNSNKRNSKRVVSIIGIWILPACAPARLRRVARRQVI